jgi:hypothetical protein
MALPPPKCGERGVFYPVFGAMELAAGLRYTTHSALSILIFAPNFVIFSDN